MTTGIFDRYFQMLADRMPPDEYGVIVEYIDDVSHEEDTSEVDGLCG